MGKPIVFFDLDGTLFNTNKQLPSSAKSAIEKLKQNGVKVAIATGRADFMFKPLLEQLQIDTYVSFNGQYAVAEGNVVFQQPLCPLELAKLEQTASKYGHPMIFMKKAGMTQNKETHPFIEASMRTLKVEPAVYQASDNVKEDIYQALLFCESSADEQYDQLFPQFHYIRWHEYSMDILPHGGSKAVGIKKVISALGIQMKDVYAFGDASNDIEMLEAVGTGVAMGDAEASVKRVADMVTRTAEADGIAYGLQELGLI